MSCPEENSPPGTASVSEIPQRCGSDFPYPLASGIEAAAGRARIVVASARTRYARCHLERCICRKSGGRRHCGCCLTVAEAVGPGIADIADSVASWLGRVSHKRCESTVRRRLSLGS